MSQTKAQLVGGVGFSTADSLTVHNGLAVTGVITATSFAGNISGDATGLTGSPNITVTNITASGNVTVGGTLTYEDVTNIDAIGIVTARSGINITGAGMTVTGISTFRGDVQVADKIIHLDDSNTAIRFPAADTFTVETAGSEALRVDSSQRLLIGETSAVLDTSNALLQMGASEGANMVLYRDDDSVAQNDSIGLIRFYSNAGSSKQEHARISATAAFTSGADDKPGNLIFYTTADGASSVTERARIDSNGNIGINQTSVNSSRKVEITQPSSYTSALRINSAGSSGNGAYVEFFVGSANYKVGGDHSTNALLFKKDGTEYMRHDSSGRLLVGTSSANGSGGAELEVAKQTMSSSDMGLASFQLVSNSSRHPHIFLEKSRGSAVGDKDLVSDGDSLGELAFRGSDGTNYLTGANILATVTGTPGTNDLPTALRFSTTADGAASATERMRIDPSGRLLVGSSSALTGSDSQYSFVQNIGNSFGSTTPGYLSLGRSEVVTSMSNNDPVGRIFFTDNAAATFAYIEAAVDAAPGSSDFPGRLVFFTCADGASSPTERLRIDSSGRVGIATVTPGNFDAGADNLVVGSGSGDNGLTIYSGNSNMANLYFADGISGSDVYTGGMNYDHSANSLALFTNGGQTALRINSSQQVLIGTNTNPGYTNRLLTIGATSRSDTYFEIRNSTSGTGGIVFSDGTAADNSSYRGIVDYGHSSDTMSFYTAASQRLVLGSSGQFGLGGANYGTSGQVITSNGSGSAPTWQDGGSSTDLAAVGTYAFCANFTNEGSPGGTRSGSELKYTNAGVYSAYTSPSTGTWRQMGDQDSASSSSDRANTLWVRVS